MVIEMPVAHKGYIHPTEVTDCCEAQGVHAPEYGNECRTHRLAVGVSSVGGKRSGLVQSAQPVQ